MDGQQFNDFMARFDKLAAKLEEMLAPGMELSALYLAKMKADIADAGKALAAKAPPPAPSKTIPDTPSTTTGSTS